MSRDGPDSQVSIVSSASGWLDADDFELTTIGRLTTPHLAR